MKNQEIETEEKAVQQENMSEQDNPAEQGNPAEQENPARQRHPAEQKNQAEQRQLTEQEKPAGALNDKKEKNLKKEVFSWIRTFAITIGVVLFLLFVVIINAQVPSESMENTIMTSDRLIGFRFAYWFAEPERGDIMLFKYPVDESLTYIKRVIGLPGEKVSIRDGHVYINDAKEPLKEDYLREEWYWENDGYEFVVPEGCYFMMGDNRNNSKDSRFWADEALDMGLTDDPAEAVEKYTFVHKNQILGKAIWVYYKQPRLVNADPYED